MDPILKSIPGRDFFFSLLFLKDPAISRGLVISMRWVFPDGEFRCDDDVSISLPSFPL